jgi:hypothetical protein
MFFRPTDNSKNHPLPGPHFSTEYVVSWEWRLAACVFLLFAER